MRRNYFKHPIRKRFIDAFPKFERSESDSEDVDFFWETWQNSPFYTSTISKDNIKHVYNHLLTAYYDWHFIYGDDLGISLNVMHMIEEYYPNVLKRLAIVDELRGMSLDDFKKSGLNINSQGANPKTETDMDALIDMVDSQTASFQLKSDEQALRAQFNSLYDGIMEDFIDRFKFMFVKLYTGVTDYIYINDISNNIEEDEEDDA